MDFEINLQPCRRRGSSPVLHVSYGKLKVNYGLMIQWLIENYFIHGCLD